MAKQWAGKIVLCVQFICWFAVSCLLFHRGLINIQQKKINQIAMPVRSNVSSNYTLEEATQEVTSITPKQYEAGRGLAAGIVMISVAAVMLVISPMFVVMKLLENRRRHRRILKTLQQDQPPKYDDVVESAPRYSTLFNFSENGEFSLDNGRVKTVVKPEQEPLTSNN